MIQNVMKRGFTLIELLVVIAIIGILASVVLASLNSARDKGTDAANKSNLNNIRAQAEIVYDNVGDYDTVCADTKVAEAISASNSATTPTVCNDAVGAWAASVQLISTASTSYYCVDSNGSAGESGTALSTNTVCP